jgi:hypothetical protein
LETHRCDAIDFTGSRPEGEPIERVDYLLALIHLSD